MIQKLLISLVLVLSLAVLGLFIAVKQRGQDIETLTAEKALLDHKLAQAHGDLEVSDANHNRMIEEKNLVIEAVSAQSAAAREAASQIARISKDVANAPDNDACVKSPPVNAMLIGLRDLEQLRNGAKGQGGDLQTDHRVQTGAGAAGAAGVP